MTDITEKDARTMSDEELQRLKKIIVEESKKRDLIYARQIKDLKGMLDSIKVKRRSKGNVKEQNTSFQEKQCEKYEFYYYDGYPKISDISAEREKTAIFLNTCESLKRDIKDGIVLISEEKNERTGESEYTGWLVRYEEYKDSIEVEGEIVEGVKTTKFVATQARVVML